MDPADDGTVSVADQTLTEGEFELALQARDGAAAAPLRDSDAVVELDVEVTPELAAEGTARDLVRLVQQARKDEDLRITDRIALHLTAHPELAAAIEGHRSWIAEQVLATSFDVAVASEGAVSAHGRSGTHTGTIDGLDAVVAISVT